jgi:protein-histidine pros-kinase
LPAQAPQAGGVGPTPPALPASALALDYGVRAFVIALAAAWGARWLTRPVARLVGSADALADTLVRGQRPPTLTESDGTREVRAAAGVFNRMAAQIRQLFNGRGLMMASISHDLRTPLTRMRIRLEGAQLPAPMRQRFVADLDEMNALIEDVLDAFRAGADAARPPQRVDVAALLQALVDDHAEHGAQARLVTAAPPVVVWTEPVALRRIVDNLVGNALRYGGSAEVALALAANGREVAIMVDDHGPGIDPAHLPAVLQPFVRLENSRNRATGGVGLGLAIANELAQRLGGTLTLVNRAGGGLRAQLHLPLQPAGPARGPG